ncbi:SDR family oxidoreductase [Shewanella sp. C32]|uniref:SDR family oxidoreductase n=1 Tax=Shewanella electrica TaxID=515560 RepID=A0ABT2FJ89_9GAMM|nr:SDR family oxidoreductase [Shewanella electrica]MCH1924508.1 SDR family oxidoreductase [Shewanella electrica]MCS4556409.1 SDR family oxidoreductase [Shewanella electrica]
MRFNDRTMVVTGAASGLGRAFAIALAQRGASLALIDNQSLMEVKCAVEAVGAEAVCWQCDVADEVSISNVCQQILATFAQVDGLVLAAGVHHSQALEHMPRQEWRRQIDVDFDGAFMLCRAFWPHMKAQGYGRILLLTGASGLFGDYFESAYATAKMGLIGLANCLSQEGLNYNIHVNTLCAHALTPMTSQHLAADVAPMFSMETPVAAAIYLMSDDAPSGQHLLAAAGSISRAYIAQSKPLYLPAARCTPEMLQKSWSRLNAHPHPSVSRSGEEQIVKWAALASKEHGVLLK